MSADSTPPQPLPNHLRATRRAVIAGGAAATATLSLPACTSGSKGDSAKLPHIGDDLAVVEQIVDTLLAIDEGSPFVPIEKTDTMANIDRLFATLPDHVRSDLSKGLTLFNLAAIVLGWYFRPFTALDRADRIAYARRWETGNKTQQGLLFALKQIVYVSYWREEITWGPIQYDGPVTRRLGIARQGLTPLPETTVEGAAK
ncbi:MAG: hypothetical protein D6761_07005 [Candidatus Dadabacteria bacterium]|nr:MAG: hypothetical protein D6761_07005 [Candidatus Dadabacteria bacterium]